MEYDTFDGSACAASDLVARLTGEVQRAALDLSDAEQRYEAAATVLGAGAIPLGIRRDLATCRRRLTMLKSLLADITDNTGCPAESA